MRPSPKSLSGSLAMARAGRCPSPQTPGAGSPTTSLRPIGASQTHEALSHARRRLVGLDLASVGHLKQPRVLASASDFTACDRALADLEAQIEIVRGSMRRAHLTGGTTVHPLRRAS